MHIDGVEIGAHCPPYIIAELSANHNGSLQRALDIVDAMAAAGAHALKLQTYTADTMTLRGAYTIDNPKSLWHGRELYDLYKEAYTPWEWHKPLFERARAHGMAAFSSPFDATSVDFLESLNVPAHKIASFENTDIPLLRKVAATGKPVIMSTGVATTDELAYAVRTLREHGCRDLLLLHCTSNYPANPTDSNLLTISHLAQTYQCEVGLSDHTVGIGVPLAAIGLGAVAIEKHVTMARADGGVDSAFSLEPVELKGLVDESLRAWQARGRVFCGLKPSEVSSRIFKRSIYVKKDIRAGEIFSADNLTVIRPSLGLEPRHWDWVIGARAQRDLAAGTPLSLDCVGGRA